MKILAIISLLFISLNSFAGGVGGGGVLANSMSQKNPEIIFHMGQTEDTVKFAYAQLVNNDWQIQRMELPKAQLEQEKTLMKALIDSQQSQYWTRVNN